MKQLNQDNIQTMKPIRVIFKHIGKYENSFVYITGIIGKYEASVKAIAKQTIPVDKICFTDNLKIINKYNWIIDNEDYYRNFPSKIDTGRYINSINKNNHTFNKAKYYKQQFYLIPRLQKYRYVVWLDGTVEITSPNASQEIIQIFKDNPQYAVLSLEHLRGISKLKTEVAASHFFRYTSTFWLNQQQPYQDVDAQYQFYIKDGYDENFFQTHNPTYRPFSPGYGIWWTCLVAFDLHNPDAKRFLDFWYLQNLKYTTQDQVSFSYVVQKLKIYPYTLPDYRLKSYSSFFRYHRHGS